MSCSYAGNPANGATNTQPSNGGQCRAPRNSKPSLDGGVQARIKKLENLVVDLMQKTTPKDGMTEPPLPGQDTGTGSPTLVGSRVGTFDGISESPWTNPVSNSDDVSSQANNYGSMKLSDSNLRYVNSAHWAAVLDGIAELKSHFEREDEDREKYHARRISDPPHFNSMGPQLLYGCFEYTTKEEILASLPARPVVDRMVSRFFNSFDMSSGQLTP